MRILVCPQEFKGSLTAGEAAQAIASGLHEALPDAEVEVLPLADGGPGTAEIICAATGGQLIRTRTRGPLGAPIDAAFALLPPRRTGAPPRAVVEAAASAGLVLVPEPQRDPAHASTFGVGLLIAAALNTGAGEITIGVGGTGTNDGGAGALQALRLRVLDEAGRDIGPGPLELLRADHLDPGRMHRALDAARLRVAVDVRNLLLGPEGATAVYGPQKGVTADLGPRIEASLAHWAMLVERDLGVAIAEMPGAGAGGGLAAGLAAIGATIESGAALVGDAVGLDAAIERADVVVTGEGSLDAQTGYGKTVGHVAERARAIGRPCVAVGGVIASLPAGMSDAEAARPGGMSSEEAMAQAHALVQGAARRLGARLMRPISPSRES